MTNTQPLAFVGPCGCEVCEKWADCDYCGTCTPEWQDGVDYRAEMEAEFARMEAERRENEMSFGDWMASR